MIQLICTPTSPFARKVRILLREKHLPAEEITVMPFAEGDRMAGYNPLGKVPALVLENGRCLYDSRVIAQYLEMLPEGPRLIPVEPEERLQVLHWEALTDGAMDAMAQIVFEGRRSDPATRSTAWIEWQSGKIERAVTQMSQWLGERDWCVGGALSLADIGLGCALGFLDLRFPANPWRQHANLAAHFGRLSDRPSFSETRPPA